MNRRRHSRRYGAEEYVGPMSPNYNFTTDADDIGLTYTDPLVYPRTYPSGGSVTSAGPSRSPMLYVGVGLVALAAYLALS